MKAKLIKTGESFLLKDVNNETLAITSGTMQGRMLSLKNCQAIERGYDLDELANELLYSKYPFHPSNDSGYWLDMYKEGFQKALELMGDKKFTLEDMMNCWNKALIFQTHKETLGEHIQSLQQTEWDVEIEMESNLHIGEVVDDSYPKGFPTQNPKLDADGCLILTKSE